ncbi:MAG: Na+/H+ antiporter subunit E, partial [Solirubrobacteraceae bacterium]
AKSRVMVEPSRWTALRRRSAGWATGWLLASLLYLLLIDITDLPELIVGAGAAALAATGFELAREQQVAGLAARLRWLAQLHRPLLRVPVDIVTVSWVAARQLVRPRAVNGQFRSVPFRCGGDERLEMGRRALAESLGSFAPNTIIVGVDADRELLLGHQLRLSGGDEAIDVMKLG